MQGKDQGMLKPRLVLDGRCKRRLDCVCVDNGTLNCGAAMGKVSGGGMGIAAFGKHLWFGRGIEE